MRNALTLAFVLFAFPVFAGDPGQKPKWLQKDGEKIEGPITLDMCIESHWPALQGTKGAIRVHHPPIPPENLRTLKTAQETGMAVLLHCESLDS